MVGPETKEKAAVLGGSRKRQTHSKPLQEVASVFPLFEGGEPPLEPTAKIEGSRKSGGKKPRHLLFTVLGICFSCLVLFV